MNFYPTNQWYHFGPGIPFGHHHFRAFADMVVETHERCGLPVLVAETGAEGSSRPGWLHYIVTQVEEAMARGAPVEGICIYPVTAYPGWDNHRICDTGVLGMADAVGTRPVFSPLAAEIRRHGLRPAPPRSARLSLISEQTHAVS
jgi:hypothetical protein